MLLTNSTDLQKKITVLCLLITVLYTVTVLEIKFGELFHIQYVSFHSRICITFQLKFMVNNKTTHKRGFTRVDSCNVLWFLS